MKDKKEEPQVKVAEPKPKPVVEEKPAVVPPVVAAVEKPVEVKAPPVPKEIVPPVVAVQPEPPAPVAKQEAPVEIKKEEPPVVKVPEVAEKLLHRLKKR